jgi:hypothetical protein
MTARRGRQFYGAANETCARLILADVAKYGGETSLMATWARLVVAKGAPTVRGPLFAQRAA